MIDSLGISGSSEFLAKRLTQAKPDDIARCEKMYRSQWRTAPFPASDLDAEAFDEFESGLRFEYAAKQIGAKPGPLADGRDIESWYDRVGEIADGLSPAITPETLLVELTNYKGEGEGLAVFDLVKHLPIYVSKQHSADLFNC